MIKSDLLFDFIRNHYVIEYYKSTPLTSLSEIKRSIFIRDIHEVSGNGSKLIPITANKNINPLFFWTKFYHFTNVDIFHKDLNDVPNKVIKCFTHTQSLDFYNYLTEFDEHVIIPLKIIPNEFPGLFDK